jgi:hypothetical protein
MTLSRRAMGMMLVLAFLLALPSEALAQPPNDSFANAQALSGSTVRATGSNVDATSEPGEPAHAGEAADQSVWYRWTAPANGRVIVDTCGSDFDTLLAVYTGAAVNALARVAGDDDSCEDEQSRLTFTARAGTTYSIAVDGFGDEGDIVLVIRPEPKPRAGRYSGRTEDGPISFNLSPSLTRITSMRARVDLDCSVRGFPVGELRLTVAFLPITVASDNTFRRTLNARRGRERLIATLVGRLRPPSRATGTISVRLFFPGGRCTRIIGPSEWTALRR